MREGSEESGGRSTLDRVGADASFRAPLRSFGLVYGGRRPDKLALCELAAEYDGASVDDVIQQATVAYLERKTYNNYGELAGVLVRLKIEPKPLMDLFAGDLETMMQRRHTIVHRADLERSPVEGAGSILTRVLHLGEIRERGVRSGEREGGMIKDVLQASLERLPLSQLEVRVILEWPRYVCFVISPDFEGQNGAIRGRQIWRHLIDDLTPFARSLIECVDTYTPAEIASLERRQRAASGGP